MREDKISVIVPVYNVEDYIFQSVGSICNQTYKNIEIILVDDGSTDSSGEKCDLLSLKDCRIKVLHKKNGGASSARNHGYKIATGKFVYFFDGDDIANENLLEVCLNEIKNNDAVIFDASVIGEFSNSEAYIRKKDYGEKSGKYILKKMLSKGDYHVAPWMYFFRKEYLDLTELDFYEGIMCEDELFTFFALYNAGGVKHINKSLYCHRMHKSSITKRNKNSYHRFFSMYTVFKELNEKSQDDDVYINYLLRITRSLIYIYYSLEKNDKDKALPLWEDIKAVLRENGYYSSTEVKLKTVNFTLGKIYGKLRRIIG